MARVFVSFATQDHALADELRRWLVDEGHEVFLDRDLHAGVAVGDEWEPRLLERLRWADAVVCVVTSVYVRSVWCTAEVAIARFRGSRLLPVLAERGVVHPLLRFSQYADHDDDPAAARAAIGEALRRVEAVGGLGWPDDRSPFPGLRPFDAELHRVFFGRTAEVEALAGLLRSPGDGAGSGVVLVVGPSGCGKSSLVRAGLRPVLADERGWWTLPPLLPGSDPEAALVRELAAGARQVGLRWTVGQVADRLREQGDLSILAEELLLACPGRHRRHRLLLVVDQFEEILVHTPAVKRARFAGLLQPALAGPVRMVAALRPEFLSQLLTSPELADLPMRTFTLRPLPREGLAAVVEGPARLAGLGLDAELVTRLVTDTGTGEALPLLAFTLAELAAGVGHGGRLSATRYEQLGGVRGALTRQADAALTDAMAATGRRRAEVIAGLLRLVTVDEQGRPSRWRVDRDELPGPVWKELDAFVTRRLLSTDTEDSGVMVGVTHEAFLSGWPPLTEAITAAASALRTRRAVELAADEWDRGRRPSQLWERGQLAAALTDMGARTRSVRGRQHGSLPAAAAQPVPHRGPAGWRARARRVLDTDRVDLSPRACAFLLASIRRDRRRRGRATTVLSTLLLISTAASGYAFRKNTEAVHQRDIAVSRQVASEADGLRQTDSSLAMQLALAAHHIAPTTESRSSLLSSFGTAPATRVHAHDAPIRSLAVSPDGHLLATGSDDHTARLSDLTGHRPTAFSILAGHTDAVRSVAFSPDGHLLATGSDDFTARLWDLTDPRNPAAAARLGGHTNSVRSVAFSPDGHVLATAGEDLTVRLWDVTDAHHPERGPILAGHRSFVTSVAFSPDGRFLASGSDDHTVRLWDLGPSESRRHAPPAILTGHTNTVTSVAFSPDGRFLASGGDDTVRLWDLTRRHQHAPPAILSAHTGVVTSVAFSRDGHVLAGGTGDAVRLWDVPTSHLLGTYLQPGLVPAVAFGGVHTLITGGGDGAVRLQDLSSSLPVDITSSMTLSGDGHLLAASAHHTLQLWDITDAYHPTALGGHPGAATANAFSPDGGMLASGGKDGAVRLWDLTDPRRLTPIGASLTGHINLITSIAFSPRRHLLATGSGDTTVRLWDITDPREVTGSTIGSHRSHVRSVVFFPNGDTLASSGADGARLWDITDLHRVTYVASLNAPPIADIGSVAFSPGGGLLAVGSGGTIRLWDVTNPRHSTTLGQPIIAPTGGAVSVVFSRDGRLLATGNDDNTVRLWDVSDPRHVTEVATLTGHTGTVRSVAFSPDGILVTASDDHTVRLWDTNTSRAAQHVCAIAGFPITRAEWEKYIPGLPYNPPCR